MTTAEMREADLADTDEDQDRRLRPPSSATGTVITAWLHQRSPKTVSEQFGFGVDAQMAA